MSVIDTAQDFQNSAMASASHEIVWTLSRGGTVLEFSGASILDHESTATKSEFANQGEVCAATNSIIDPGSPDRWRGNLHVEFNFSVDSHATLSNTFMRQDIGQTPVDGLVVKWTISDGPYDIRTGGSVGDFDLLGGVIYTFVADYTIDPTVPISTSAVGVPPDEVGQTNTITDCAPDAIGCLPAAVDDWSIRFNIIGSAETDCDGNGIPDPVEIADDPTLDCNHNNIRDSCEIDASFVIDESFRSCWHSGEANLELDMNNNGVLDSCEFNICNIGELPDIISTYMFNGRPDCNQNFIPDNCDIASGFSSDCDVNGIPDECDVIPSSCDPDYGLGCDNDNDGILFCNETCPADFDNNGCVNVTDFLVLLAGWGAHPTGHPADMNCDGSVNVTDLLLFIGSWGDC
ncbi:MAG: hypothetical protein IID30_13405 [Planctomycetes bacterium]|nr:hypothetical protein [Planctomycetota bacterium]